MPNITFKGILTHGIEQDALIGLVECSCTISVESKMPRNLPPLCYPGRTYRSVVKGSGTFLITTIQNYAMDYFTLSIIF